MPYSYLLKYLLSSPLSWNVFRAFGLGVVGRSMGDSRPKPRQRRRLRPATLLLGVCLVVYCVLFITSPSGSGNQETSAHSPLTSNSKRLTPELLNNLSLHEDECNTAFPGLTKDIDDAVGAGPFKLKQAGELGPLQGRIKDGQVRVRWVGILDV